MADELVISGRTLHYYLHAEKSPWQEGRHYKRSTPSNNSPWVWNRDLTLKAWEVEKGGAA
ncbi:MAG TPA: hypothetical protein QF626_02195 [Prochlorococcaceae cyanobacterium Fu_MAG_50]|nr:hypothetical protein [Prochlorococcaceae cyanobacterium Fu_MAG_50]